MSSSAHIFAFFTPSIDTIIEQVYSSSIGRKLTCQDEALAHRLQRVVRIQTQQEALLFGRKYSVRVILESIHKTHITFSVISSETLKPLQPIINACFPLIEKASLEQAVYSATVLGVHTIYFIPTAKGKRHTLAPSELERLYRIIAAASEQSKQFLAPRIQHIAHWKDISNPGQVVLADIQGDCVIHHMTTLKAKSRCTFIVGPEGDFTDEEKQQLHAAGALKVKLGPTVLRSEDAVTIGIGILRSLLYN